MPDVRFGSIDAGLDCVHEPPIRNVSDTALWVAAYRAMETDRPDALFIDPHARRMAGKRGMDIVGSLPFGQSMAWSMSVRTAVMDEVILQCVERGARAVLNLGAGLDTRAYRLRLPPSLRWVDVDLPAMTAYRHDCLGDNVPSCEHAHVAADLSDPTERAQVFASARCCDGPWLVITEGLLVYLSPDQVSDLAAQLRAETPAQWWVADLISPMLQQTMGVIWYSPLADAGAPFRFAPHDSRSFFESLGWQEAEFHSTWAASIRLGRTAPHGPAWDQLWKWSERAARETMKRMSGIALLKRVP